MRRTAGVFALLILLTVVAVSAQGGDASRPGCSSPSSRCGVTISGGATPLSVASALPVAGMGASQDNCDYCGNNIGANVTPEIGDAISVTVPPTTTTAPPQLPQARVDTPSPSLQPCDGIYPPCFVAERESHGNYGAVSPDGTYRGKWQFLQSTWDGVAERAGRPDLVGIPPDQASPADQDAMAAAEWNGGAGCGAWGAC